MQGCLHVQMGLVCVRHEPFRTILADLGLGKPSNIPVRSWIASPCTLANPQVCAISYGYMCARREGLPCSWLSMPPRASRMPEDICSAPDVASASSCMSTSVRLPKLSCMWYMQMLHAPGTCESLREHPEVDAIGLRQWRCPYQSQDKS